MRSMRRIEEERGLSKEGETPMKDGKRGTMEGRKKEEKKRGVCEKKNGRKAADTRKEDKPI